MIIKIDSKSGIPLLGSIYFGIIDRGTNLLQVRASTLCNLNCIFCSVSAGPQSKLRKNDYIVELSYLLDYLREVIKFKERNDIEIHLDSVGEPTTYPNLIELIKEIRKIREVKIISMQSNGTLLNEEKIKALSEAGLNRINLSMNAFDNEKAKRIAGCDFYDIEHVKGVAKEIMKSNIELLIAPVYLPGINDKDIKEIIKFGLNISTNEKKVKFGIQKYLSYKYGRKPKGIKEQSWWQFYNKSIKAWEDEFKIRLKLSAKDFNIVKCKQIPIIFKKNQIINVEIKEDGWLLNEKLGIAENRVITLINCNKNKERVKARIISNKDGIYLAKSV